MNIEKEKCVCALRYAVVHCVAFYLDFICVKECCGVFFLSLEQ